VLTLFATLMTVAGLVLAGLAGYVAWRHGTKAGLTLAILLISVAWWGLAYAVELSLTDVLVKSRWGDVKYVGICVLPPAWLVFVLQYTGRGRLVTRRLVAALAIEPLVVLALLANGATHDLVRFYPKTAAGEELPVVGTGPVFWVHLVYANLIILTATGLFVASMVKLSRTYRRMAVVLVAAALLPWAANLLHNLEVGWFARLDLTPFAFIVTGVVLVWGLFRERLVNLSPLARSVVVDYMADPVFVLDAFGRIADVNPAGAQVLNSTQPRLVGLVLADLLPHPIEPTAQATLGQETPVTHELSLGDGADQRTFDVLRQPLTDRGDRAAGELVVLRDITERVQAEKRLQHLLAERSRVATALQASMVPDRLPAIPMSELASRYEPAGDGSEIGGDFLDIFPFHDGSWGVVLGDVSGKGADAAAVTALARYTLRTLAHPRHSPSHTLRELNTRLLATTEDERHCTLLYAVARPKAEEVLLTISLAGHHPPLLVPRTGVCEPVGKLGTALGLFDRPELHDSTLVMAPGDLLCAFTDGLIEARNGKEMFGTERVAAILGRHAHRPADEVAAELVEAARTFHGGDLADDLALLLFRVRETDPDIPEHAHATNAVDDG
jgi:PAS domain S-box-containing protein